MTGTNLTYEGIVDLTLNINGTIVKYGTHNDGCEYLMKAFAKYMTGNATGQDFEIPKFLDLKTKLRSGYEWDSYLILKPELTSRFYEKDPQYGWVARFTGVISFTDLRDIIPDGDPKQYRLYLITDEDNSPGNTEPNHEVAFIDVESRLLSNIGPGVTLVVEWTMRIKNNGEA